LSRRQARDIAFKVLFQVDQVEADPAQALVYLQADKAFPAEVLEYAEALIAGVLEHREVIDTVMQRYSRTWKMERMFSVDRVLLRLGIYEVMIESGIPPAIAIDEAIELGKQYGEEASPAFVNAVLDQVRVDYDKMSG
jgi:N utilization substance protein B